MLVAELRIVYDVCHIIGALVKRLKWIVSCHLRSAAAIKGFRPL